MLLYDLNQPHSEAMQYDLDRLLEVVESRLHNSLAMLKDSKNAYRQLKAVKQYGSIAQMQKARLAAAPDIDISVLK